MKIEELKEKYGSLYRISKVFAVDWSTVKRWEHAGKIPMPAQRKIEIMSNGEFRADI